MLDLRSSLVVLVAFIVFVVIRVFVKQTWIRRRLPPGPFPLPVLGNFLQIYKQGIVPYLVKMGDMYGSVCTVHIGSRPTVILTGYQVVKEALVDLGDAFVGRGAIPVFERLFENSSLTLAEGESWKQLRQFSLLTLRDFGMGKKSIEEVIQREVKFLAEHFKNTNQDPTDPTMTVKCASSNILVYLIMGTRYDYSDKKWMKILHDMHEAFNIICSAWGQMYDIFPSIMQALPGPHNKIFSLFQGFIDAVKERVKSNMTTLDPNCPRDFIDCYLIRMKEEKDPQSPFTVTELGASITDMFLGSSESTTITLYYGLLILIKHPEIQVKLQEEIDHVIGSAREPKVEDRNQMPYMNAVIHEIQRISDVLPMGVIRCTTRDVTLQGHHIPKGTDVLTMLTTVLRDPSQFETPSEFNVNHFLDENGKFKKNNGFMAFSLGKRACIGESLVRMQLFIFFTSILQKFTLKPTVDPKDLDITPKDCGIETLPPVHKIIFIPRE
ncbi:cytochrome P450 2F2-like [Discoglossus pictus]